MSNLVVQVKPAHKTKAVSETFAFPTFASFAILSATFAAFASFAIFRHLCHRRRTAKRFLRTSCSLRPDSSESLETEPKGLGEVEPSAGRSARRTRVAGERRRHVSTRPGE